MKKELKRQPCEIYSRVVGYLRPVSQWNDAKQVEFKERKNYDKQLETLIHNNTTMEDEKQEVVETTEPQTPAEPTPETPAEPAA